MNKKEKKEEVDNDHIHCIDNANGLEEQQPQQHYDEAYDHHDEYYYDDEEKNDDPTYHDDDELHPIMMMNMKSSKQTQKQHYTKMLCSIFAQKQQHQQHEQYGRRSLSSYFFWRRRRSTTTTIIVIVMMMIIGSFLIKLFLLSSTQWTYGSTNCTGTETSCTSTTSSTDMDHHDDFDHEMEQQSTSNNVILPAIYAPVGDNISNQDFWPIVPEKHWNYMTRIYQPKWKHLSDKHHDNNNHEDRPWCWLDKKSKNITSNTPAGLIFVKVHKAASSTLAGITMRIAHHYGSAGTTTRFQTNMPCSSLQHHEDSRHYRNRDPNISFLFTSIRHPAHRAISWIYYVLSNQQKQFKLMQYNQNHNNDTKNDDDSTLTSIISEGLVLNQLQRRSYFLKGNPRQESRSLNEAGSQTGYLHTGNRLSSYHQNNTTNTSLSLWHSDTPNWVRNITLAQRRVAQVMTQYDFILLVERLEESLVVLQFLLNLSTTDLLYISNSKQSGRYAFVQQQPSATKNTTGCHYIQPSVYTPKIKEFLSSSTFYAQNYEDYLLYKAVNASLDLTISHIDATYPNPRNKDHYNKNTITSTTTKMGAFQQALHDYQQMMKDASSLCEKEAIFPCAEANQRFQSTRTYQLGDNNSGAVLAHVSKFQFPPTPNCYFRDWGCGYACLDRIFGTP